LGAIASIFAIKSVSKTFDYRNHAGALVLGLQKVAVKTHGSADQAQFYSAIQMLYQTVKQDIVGKIKTSMENK
jgi:glycerol-3-phosphate acyltransferase PlsX